eukprot:g9153.t1
MSVALLAVQSLVSALCLCALCVLFYFCWLDLARHRNRPGHWVARVHKFRQLVIATCIPSCILLLATTVWNSGVSFSTESVVCKRLTQGAYVTATLSQFFVYCFLYARLHTVGLFHPAQVQPSSQREGCLLRSVDRAILAFLCVYALAPFACFFLPAGFDVIGGTPICVPTAALWLMLPFFAFELLFGLVLVGGFSFQVYRLSKLPTIDRDADSRRTFERMLGRTLQAGVVMIVVTSVTILSHSFPSTRYLAFYFLFPSTQTLDCFMTYYCTTNNRTVASSVTELASLSHLHMSEDSKMKMAPPPGISLVRVSTRASASRNMITMIMSSTARQNVCASRNWLALKLKVFGLTRISEESEKTKSTHPQVSALNSKERSITMSKAVLIIPPSHTEVVQRAVNSLAINEGLMEQEGWRRAKTVEVFEANTRSELKKALAHQTASQLVSPATDVNTQIMQRTHQSSSAACVLLEDNFKASARVKSFVLEEKYRNQRVEDDFQIQLKTRPGRWHIEDLRMVDDIMGVEEDDFQIQLKTRPGRWHIEDLRMVDDIMP